MQFKLDQLIEFNPALIYGLQPESSPKRLAGSDTFINGLLPEAGQYQDMLDGYLFAQDTILPIIKAKGFLAVTESRLLEWIKTLHAYLGKTLLANWNKQAGIYTDDILSRWHKGAILFDEFVIYISGLHKCKKDNELALFLENNYQLKRHDGQKFITLLHKIKENTSIQLRDTTLNDMSKIDKRHYVGMLTLYKLFVAHNTEILSVEDKQTTSNVVKICMFPEKIPAAMRIFAKETLANYAACDKTDLNQITRFLAETFYQLTEIHPFANANGRTATCLINILLRSFELPSILLRHPGEHADKNSLYFKAIELIDQDRAHLQNLIFHRIQEAQQKMFSDEVLEKTIHLNVKLCELITRIHKKYPSFNLESMRDNVNRNDPNYTEDKQQYALTAMITIATKQEKILDEKHKNPLIPFTLHAKLNKEETTLLISNFQRISNKSDWKINQKNGLIAWIEVPDLNEAKKIKIKLEKTAAFSVFLSCRQDNKIPVITCKNINYGQLNNCVDKIKKTSSSPKI